MTLESPLDCKEIKPVNSKGNQSWIFIRRTDAEAETPIPTPVLWPGEFHECIVHGVAKNHTWLSDFHFHFVFKCTRSVRGDSNGTPLQYSCLENPMDGGAWWAAVHWVAKSQTWLSDFTFTHWRRKWHPTPLFLPWESQGRGAWWAAVYGVTQGQTRLKQLSSSSSRSVRTILNVKNIYVSLDYEIRNIGNLLWVQVFGWMWL